ncbi:sugar transporter [Ancylomarina euxinus]|uniref:Sugar transporter n=1 Tax=Ancylomarina euxinus TaxID=2283627 RepID=A0A425XWM3_9BACT|nr:polysaccharide biosynthesis/export family protein [Ancylomarina euxinus]MCZ4696385.1 polysaccharide biosynthesis/export family protein [Ancylomarina euxinus]MUP16462.1 sugar transporter [Ancylomarina euxinus]RRG19036.1 sugar transporter [Ancylomarina euxinus]
MNKFYLVSFTIILMVLLFSCKTSKNLVYLNNTVDQEVLPDLTKHESIYKIKINDNLFVDIQSLSPEINAVFNPSQGSGPQSGTQQNYGQLSGQYLNGFLVDQRGNINLPIIGQVNLVGKSLDEARQFIQTKSDEYIKDATVKVKLLSFKITVMGEVKNPGVYYNYNSHLTVLEGISMASGITDYGRIKKILVLRPLEKGNKTYRLDLTNKNFLNSDAFFLQPNDVVYVEPDKYKNVKLNSPMYSLLLSTISTLILIFNVL